MDEIVKSVNAVPKDKLIIFTFGKATSLAAVWDAFYGPNAPNAMYKTFVEAPGGKLVNLSAWTDAGNCKTCRIELMRTLEGAVQRVVQDVSYWQAASGSQAVVHTETSTPDWAKAKPVVTIENILLDVLPGSAGARFTIAVDVKIDTSTTYGKMIPSGVARTKSREGVTKDRQAWAAKAMATLGGPAAAAAAAPAAVVPKPTLERRHSAVGALGVHASPPGPLSPADAAEAFAQTQPEAQAQAQQQPPAAAAVVPEWGVKAPAPAPASASAAAAAAGAAGKTKVQGHTATGPKRHGTFASAVSAVRRASFASSRSGGRSTKDVSSSNGTGSAPTRRKRLSSFGRKAGLEGIDPETGTIKHTPDAAHTLEQAAKKRLQCVIM